VADFQDTDGLIGPLWHPPTGTDRKSRTFSERSRRRDGMLSCGPDGSLGSAVLVCQCANGQPLATWGGMASIGRASRWMACQQCQSAVRGDCFWQWI